MAKLLLNVYHHPNSLKHFMGKNHLEAPIRIEVIEEALKQSSLKVKFIEARSALQNEIIACHDYTLFENVKESAKRSETIFTLDTLANQYTYQASLTAAGGAIQIAENITSKVHQFAMLRPPGHHSTYNAAMGFCFFNNIALATHNLLTNKFKRIAIIDVDHHHGNGTQAMFDGYPNVLYASLHADPLVAFPGTGFAEEIGVGEGMGKNVNIPLPIQTQDRDFLTGFDEVITPIVQQFKPEVIMVSLGLDALDQDPYGVLSLTPQGYFEIGKRIGSLANELCKKRVGVILEGGYKYSDMGLATVKFFEGLHDFDAEPTLDTNVSYRFDQVLRGVKGIQRNYWF